MLVRIVALLVVWTVSSCRARFLPTARLSEAEWGSYHETEPQGPGTYAFGYDIEDPETGNTQFRQEERHPNGTVTGSYGSVQPDGNVQVVHYIADQDGYRVRIENSIRRSEDFPPTQVAHSPQLVSAIASQTSGQSPVHEQHVRPISNQERYVPPITEQNHFARPIKQQNKHTPPSNGHNQFVKPIGNHNKFVNPVSSQHQYVKPFNSQNHYSEPIRNHNQYVSPIRSENHQVFTPIGGENQYVKPIIGESQYLKPPRNLNQYVEPIRGRQNYNYQSRNQYHVRYF